MAGLPLGAMTPPSIGDVLGAAGACPEIELRGKRWKVGHPTQRAKDRLEKLVVSLCWESIKAAQCGVPELDERLVADFTKAVRNREYRTGGAGWAEAFGRPEGQVAFALSLLQEHHPEATADDAVALMSEKGDEFNVALAQVVPGFFGVIAADLKMPPEKREAWVREKAAAFLAALKTPSSSPPPSST